MVLIAMLNVVMIMEDILLEKNLILHTGCHCPNHQRNSMEWINVKEKPLPDPKKYKAEYCIPAISKLFGYGFIIRSILGEKWDFTNDHKYYRSLEHVTHWMLLPKKPKE